MNRLCPKCEKHLTLRRGSTPPDLECVCCMERYTLELEPLGKIPLRIGPAPELQKALLGKLTDLERNELTPGMWEPEYPPKAGEAGAGRRLPNPSDPRRGSLSSLRPPDIRNLSPGNLRRSVPVLEALALAGAGALSRLAAPGSWVVDLGYSDGIFTSAICQQFGPHYGYISIEANQQLSEIARRAFGYEEIERGGRMHTQAPKTTPVLFDVRNRDFATRHKPGYEIPNIRKSENGPDCPEGIGAAVAAFTPNCVWIEEWYSICEQLKTLLLPRGALLVVALTEVHNGIARTIYPNVEATVFGSFAGPLPVMPVPCRSERELFEPFRRDTRFSVEPFWRTLTLGAWLVIKDDRY